MNKFGEHNTGKREVIRAHHNLKRIESPLSRNLDGKRISTMNMTMGSQFIF